MTDIKRVIDGDTLQTTDDTLRVSHINTPESVHPDSKKNTLAGEQAAAFAKDVLPEDSKIVTHDYGRDHFGRQVAGVKRDINGVNIDYGLVALDQEMSTYFTEYGEHPDPLKHDQYKEYYSKDVPYQFGTAAEPMTKDELVSMENKHKLFTETYNNFKHGIASQEQLDEATVDLYKDETLVKRYRQHLANWNRPLNEENFSTIRGAMRLAMEDPKIREQYNRAVRNGHLIDTPVPEGEPSFWERSKASFSMLGSVSNLSDTEELWRARQHGSDYNVPETELVKGLPSQYHKTILTEAANGNTHSALVMRDQLLEDISNNKVFDDMEWYAQLGYGALAIVADPLAVVPAGGLAKIGTAVNTGVKAWTTSRLITNSAKLTTWASAGAVEGAVMNFPRLSGDHTYTSKDYQLDILFDASFGLGIGTLVEGVGKPLYSRYMVDVRASRAKEQADIQAYVNGQLKETQETFTPVKDLPDVEFELVDDLGGKLASTDKTGKIRIQKGTTPEQFFDYLEGNVDSPTSKQKSVVLQMMKEQGFTVSKLREFLDTPEKVTEFLSRHEQSHVTNNDRVNYFTEQERVLGKPDYMTQNKLDIETRANIDALTQMGFNVSKGVELDAQDVITASKMNSEKAPDGEGSIVLTEENLTTLAENNSGKTIPKVPEDTYKTLQKASADAKKSLIDQSLLKIANGISTFKSSGEQAAFKAASKANSVVSNVGKTLGKLTSDLATRFQEANLETLNYVGTRITEVGRGFGGRIRRVATGGLIREAAYKEAMMKIAPAYKNALDKYAINNGRGAVGRLVAQQAAGADSALVNKFNREVFTIQELRRQGKPVSSNIDVSVVKFVDEWDKFMEHNHNKLVDSNINGFTAERKIKHYIPHIWDTAKLTQVINNVGEDKVISLFEEAYRKSVNNNTNPSNPNDALELAKRHIEWIKSKGDADGYMPAVDSRAKARIDLDTTTTVDGVSIMDLLDTDVINVGTKYANRMAGWVGLSKSTDGMLTSQLDLDLLKNKLIQEGQVKGVDTASHELYYDDMLDLMFGRPTRGGLTTELRQLKDLTALTRMGGLGTAQLIETGQVITRSILNLFSNDKTFKKVMQVAKGQDEVQLIREIQAISNITDDIEWLDRQSVHLDQNELAKVNKARQLSLWVADKATFGSLKAPASRLLGKTSGFNAVRRMQSRIAQASFTIDVAKHFHSGSGVMSNARMADIGLTDSNGVDTGLTRVFKEFVEFDNNGLPTKLNVHKWDKATREKFQYALLRDEAQQVQRTIVGELPPWMNKPMMSLALQFRQMPIVAQNKQLARALAFADKEAAMATILNTVMAGLVRYSKFAALGLGVSVIAGSEWREPNGSQMDISKYIAQFGLFPDAYDLVTNSSELDSITGANNLAERQLPVYGLMQDYVDAVGADNGREFVDAAQGLTPLGNTAYGDMIHTWLQETMDSIPEIAYGEEAIKLVESREGSLNNIERRIVREEGYTKTPYLDDKGNVTVGAGRTREFKDKTFKETVKIHVGRAKRAIPTYDTLPPNLQEELVQATYRGDVSPRFNWVKLFNKGDYQSAAEELLNHSEYKMRKELGEDGVTKRLEALQKAILNYK